MILRQASAGQPLKSVYDIFEPFPFRGNAVSLGLPADGSDPSGRHVLPECLSLAVRSHSFADFFLVFLPDTSDLYVAS